MVNRQPVEDQLTDLLLFPIARSLPMRILAARGSRSLQGRVTTKRSWIPGDALAPTQRHDDETMLTHWEASATTETAPFRRNHSGAGGFGLLGFLWR